MAKYKITIDRVECIQCGNCYGLDPQHFEADDNFKSMVVGGETDEVSSTGIFDDDKISTVTEVANKCPVGIIGVEEI
jgi:ferredoxin